MQENTYKKLQIESYRDAADYLLSVPRFTRKNPLAHTRALLARLGDPQEAFKVVHVAGTNGKGSVCSYLEGILLAGRKHTGMFTSPHLVRLNERIRTDGKECSDETFFRAFCEVMAAVDGMAKENMDHPTFFELLFATAMVIFREERVEYAILETGLGGRLDATNIVERPLTSIITSIGLDHTKYLGDTIPEIAAEKAGIVKPGVPVVFDASKPEAAAVVTARAKELRAPAFPLCEDSVKISGSAPKDLAFSFDSGYYKYTDVKLAASGIYQAQNAALALLAYDVLSTELDISRRDALRGMEYARWPGRMEEILPGVFLDGAHNADGIRAFLETVEKIGTGRDILLFAAAGDKDYESMAAALSESGLFSEVIVTEFSGGRAAPAEELCRVFKKYGKRDVCPVRAQPDAKKALRMGLAHKNEKNFLFVAGSLYLAGRARELLKEERR